MFLLILNINNNINNNQIIKEGARSRQLPPPPPPPAPIITNTKSGCFANIPCSEFKDNDTRYEIKYDPKTCWSNVDGGTCVWDDKTQKYTKYIA